MEPFIINLANNVQYSVTPVYQDGAELSYQLSIDGKPQGSITPFLEDIGLTWRSDDIDPLIVDEIGELIEDHEE
ncbi:hypothetical protein [Pedobacter cryoconitis]|uniref:Uncharacterized protein n=1 Tax=Pedobacter cryoconitis TaxID=188932 RepID=A0A327SK79_9SPHI|nr:hypothetical protein [Pedobacter cryoconitis]RAJ28882.1 hypothetical protein LY11_03156 [Pedobacter cryoconitis]